MFLRFRSNLMNNYENADLSKSSNITGPVLSMAQKHDRSTIRKREYERTNSSITLGETIEDFLLSSRGGGHL